jgi:hypothetical protein
MRKINYSIIAILGIFLSGCVTNNTKIKIEAIDKTPLNLPSPNEVVSDPLKWYIIAKNSPDGKPGSITYFFNDISKRSGNKIGVAISANDFKRLKNNDIKKRKYILQLKAILAAYKNYYEKNKK